MKNTNIEVEGGEILIQSKEGHYAVIPAKHRQEVMDMVKDSCDDCINNYIQTLPKDSDYAQYGSLLPDWNKIKATLDKKKITLERRPYTAVQSSTYVAPKVIPPLEKKQFNPREQPVFRADTRTERERKVAQEYTESVLNSVEKYKKPLHWIAGSELLRWTANPLKGVGDIVSFVAPNSALAKDLPNTDEDVLEHKKIQLSPYISRKEKLNNSINEAVDLGINSLINVGTMELGFALPKAFVSPAMTNMFRGGSKANFAADFLQLLTKTDLDKISDGDRNEIANLILNSSSLLSKMDNFDASTIYNNIKNWKSLNNASKSPLNNIINNNGVYTINGVSGMSFNNIQAATKYLKEFIIDTYKDIFNISQSINQQTQRE